MKSETSLRLFRYLAGFASVYHFVLGLAGTFGSPDLVLSVIARVYGVVPQVDAQFLYMVKFISAYMIVFAITMALLAWKPVKYRDFVWVPVALFSIRILERLFFAGLLGEAFGTTFAENLRVIVPISILLCGLLILRPKAEGK